MESLHNSQKQTCGVVCACKSVRVRESVCVVRVCVWACVCAYKRVHVCVCVLCVCVCVNTGEFHGDTMLSCSSSNKKRQLELIESSSADPLICKRFTHASAEPPSGASDTNTSASSQSSLVLVLMLVKPLSVELSV